jgi:hypothetical protein
VFGCGHFPFAERRFIRHTQVYGPRSIGCPFGPETEPERVDGMERLVLLNWLRIPRRGLLVG